MITLEIIRRQLSPCLKRGHQAFNRLNAGEGILMITDDVSADPHHIYLGTADDCAALIGRAGSLPFTLISAGDSEALCSLCIPDHVNLLVTELSLSSLYNRLFGILQGFTRFEDALRASIRDDSTLESAAAAFCRGTGVCLVIVNEGFRRLAACMADTETPPLFQPILDNAYLPFTLSHIYQQRSVPLGHGRTGFFQCSFPQDRFHYLERRIVVNGEIVMRLIFAAQEPPSLYFADIAECFSLQLEVHLVETGHSAGIPSENVNSLLSDLIERKIVKHTEIADRLLTFSSFPIKNHFMLALLGFANYSAGIPWNYIREQLHPIFPNSVIGFYKKQFVLLIPMANYIKRPEYDKSALLELLNYFDAYFVEGDHANVVDSVPFLFFQAETTLRIAPRLARPEDYRIFRFEHYRVYMMIELMCSAAFKTYHDGSLYFLASHGYIMVVRYDQKYGTDLEKTLVAYMEENCNTSSTAQRLFMHRNSIINRITKIEELIGESLKDPMVIEQLRFSVHVKNYIENYLGEPFPGREPDVPAEIDAAILDL